jgi:hypothetical protein
MQVRSYNTCMLVCISATNTSMFLIPPRTCCQNVLNIISVLCHSFFKEFKAGDAANGESRRLPSLTCRSDFETRKAKWDGCVVRIAEDPAAKIAFDTQMDEVAETPVLGMNIIFGTQLPRGADGKLPLFRMLECDAP